MAVYKVFASEDASIYSRYPDKNAGLDEILEISVKNNIDYVNNNGTFYGEDIRRSIIKFSNEDINKLKGYSTSGSSYEVYLRLYIARAENLSKDYSLEFRELAQNFEMGTGHFNDDPNNHTGVSWYQTGSYIGGFLPPVINWNVFANPNGSSFYTVSGGGSWNSVSPITQSFSYSSNKDVNVNLTNIADNWFLGASNNGLIVKHTSEIENNSGSFMVLNFFSTDTHTIYPPTLEIRWDDQVYNPGILQTIYDSNTVLTIANNLGFYNWKSEVVKVRINSRDKYPTRVFTTSSLYMTNKALPENSYWSLLDLKTNDVVIEYDPLYTKISCDPTSSFFNLYMNGLEPERYYKVLIRTDLQSGEVINWDSDLIFKVVK